ncbi:threonine--tRNA ligase [Paenibacillus sp. B01]|uniref:threonine--tRNA ligase n=1 Tax=Paenibacillus sp. B01 TaxID=2660554 RepID=UPI00129BC3D8|nr:threonine--tRNA ligase [Paenibacillus sp. B01]QGG57702.1 threonine--tRNA ligase [Paenibacillus sp. B01]
MEIREQKNEGGPGIDPAAELPRSESAGECGGSEIRIALPSGKVRRYPAGTTAAAVADSIRPGLRAKAAAARLDGRLVDLDLPLESGGALELVLPDDPEALELLRRSAAHVLAHALKRLYGDDAVTIGSCFAGKDGFGCDARLDAPVGAGELVRIEKEMERIVAEDLPFTRMSRSRSEAEERLAERGEALQLELLRERPGDGPVALYGHGGFEALEEGPLLPSTGRLKAFRLMSVAGAYWRGDSVRPMLQRIHGAAFWKKAQLGEHLERLEEARRRDHRKLGKELQLFLFSEEAPGMPFYLPRGMAVRTALEDFARRLQLRRGYEEVRTPLLMNRRLWEESGHWDHYKDQMYFCDVDGSPYALKPMNCPGHMLIFGSRLRSYRELPLRLAEFGQVHRHEFSGALSGMMRVRSFCQDDAHLFVRPDQIGEEIGRVMDLIDEVYGRLGFSYRMELSTRPADSMGAAELWEQAEGALRDVLERRGADYRLNEGDGAFYGPKIDYHVLDALGRSWQCGTIQLDFQMPEKFDLGYVGEDGARHRPVVIHRAVYGSIDRFLGILTEHFAGAFPLWLAPVQARVLPVSEAQREAAERMRERLAEAGLRADADSRAEKLGSRIREAQLAKIPYMLVVGEAEADAGRAAVRSRGGGDVGTMELEAFVRLAEQEIQSK